MLNFAMIFVMIFAGLLPAQECRQPRSTSPSLKGEVAQEVILIGATAGAEAARRGWGSSAGSVAQTVIWAKTQERINSRNADSRDYETCRISDSRDRQTDSQERVALEREKTRRIEIYEQSDREKERIALERDRFAAERGARVDFRRN